MTTITMPQGVTASTGACWVLVYPNGDAVDVDDTGEPHYSEDVALKVAPKFADKRGTPAPRPLPDPCYRLTALCGYVLDEDDEGVFCLPSVEALTKTAEASGWIRHPLGWACSKDCDNGCLDAVAEYEREHPPAAPVADGQEPLIEVTGNCPHCGALPAGHSGNCNPFAGARVLGLVTRPGDKAR